MEGVKRDIEFGLEESMRCKRGRFDSIHRPLEHGFLDPPWIAKQLAFTINDEKDEIDDLIRKIKNGICEIENGFHKNGFHKGKIKKKHIKRVEESTKDVEACTKELARMIKADPRLCNLLGRDSLELIVSLLRHEQNEKLQAHAAIILKAVVTYSRNKNEVGVVIENITPVVLHLICSPDVSVRAEALWLLRNLVFKLSKSSIEQALSPVTSIILDNSISDQVDKVLYPASAILRAVCQEHPKLSREKLKLVVQALMKLIESYFYDQLVVGCLGLALLCDGREEMIVEEKDLKPLISNLVQFMNWEERGAIINGLLCLGSIVRWGNDDAIEAIILEEGNGGSIHILSILLEEGDMYIVKHVCWIISNITARKRELVGVVLCGNPQLLKLVVKVVQTCTLPDVVKEALWAISNAMCCVGYDDSAFDVITPWFWDKCFDKSWVRRLTPFLSDNLLVMIFIEGMIKIGAAKLTCMGEMDLFGFHTIFKGLWYGTERRTPAVLEFSFEEEWEPQFLLFYDGLRKEWLFKKG